MLLTESRIFLWPTGYRIDHSGLAARAKNTHRQYELFWSSLAWVPSSTFAATKVSAIWKPRPSTIAVWFVAPGVHTAEMMM